MNNLPNVVQLLNIFVCLFALFDHMLVYIDHVGFLVAHVGKAIMFGDTN